MRFRRFQAAHPRLFDQLWFLLQKGFHFSRADVLLLSCLRFIVVLRIWSDLTLLFEVFYLHSLQAVTDVLFVVVRTAVVVIIRHCCWVEIEDCEPWNLMVGSEAEG